MYNKSLIDENKKKLEGMLGSIQKEIAILQKHIVEIDDVQTLTEVEPETRVDDVYWREDNEVAIKELEERLGVVKSALSAIQDGTYGVCHNCNSTISEDRLLANPAALYCLSCEQQIELHEEA